MSRPRNDEPRYATTGGYARVWLAGRWVRLGAAGSPQSYARFDEAVAEWRARGCPTWSPPRAPVVSELTLAYLTSIRGTVSASRLWHARMACRVLRRLYGSEPSDSIGPARLKRVRDAMEADGLARVTVNDRVGIIRGMYRWAVEEELVPASVWDAMRAVRGLQRGKCRAHEGEPVRPIAGDALELTLPHLSEVVRAMVLVQFHTGARPGEVAALTTGDIDTSGKVWTAALTQHKNAHRGKSRTLYLGPKAQAAILPYLRRDLAEPVFSPEDAREERRERLRGARQSHPSVNRGRDAERALRRASGGGERRAYEVGSYRQAIRRACERAGVPVWKPHQLRHTAATLARKRFGVEAAQAMLGHDDLRATMIYAERSDEQARRVALEVG